MMFYDGKHISFVSLIDILKTTYPDPDDTNPATRDGVDVGEAPVTKGGDDRGDGLGNAESTEQGIRGSLHEEESVRASDEDQGLRDDSNLEVHNHMKLPVVRLHRRGLEGNVELVLEESSLLDNNNQCDATMTQQRQYGDKNSQ